MTVLSDKLQLSPAATSRHVAQMAGLSAASKKFMGAGFLTMREDPMNRRFKIVTLTDSGKAFVENLLKEMTCT